MTVKKSKKSPRVVVRPFHDICRSEAFWLGIVDGLSAHKFLLTRCDAYRLLGKGDSVYEAWKEVGDLLTESLAEYGDGEPTEAKAADHSRCSEFTVAN